jgi:Flp pilus assembly protein TadD
MSTSVDDARRQARFHFDAADYDACLRAAREGLSTAPDDVDLLVLAGRAGVELDAPDAVEQLQRATELAPENPSAWHHLGESLAAEGRMEEADAAFRRTVELDPSDQVALSNLGHTALAAGRSEEGADFLSRAADIAHAASTAAISLVDMYRSFGQYENALAQAQKLVEAVPDDMLSWLDVAELSLQVGRLDDARAAFEQLRDLEDVPGQEAYPLHGMIQVEIRRAQWDRAKELAAQAGAIDQHGLTTDIATFLDAQGSDAPAEEALSVADVDGALAASLTTYRKMLADNRRLAPEALS